MSGWILVRAARPSGSPNARRPLPPASTENPDAESKVADAIFITKGQDV